MRVKQVIKNTERYRGLQEGTLRGCERRRKVAYARHEAVWVSRKIQRDGRPVYSTTQIGSYFGGMDHTSVMYAIQKIDARLLEEPRLRDELTLIAYFSGAST